MFFIVKILSICYNTRKERGDSYMRKIKRILLICTFVLAVLLVIGGILQSHGSLLPPDVEPTDDSGVGLLSFVFTNLFR